MQIINFGLLKSPMNWVLVAFTTALIMFGSHCIIKGVNSNEQD